MTQKSLTFDFDDQVSKLIKQKKLLIVKSAERFANAARKSGVAEMKITDAQIEIFFKEIATRFRWQTRKSSFTPLEASQSTHYSARTITENPHGR